MNENVQKTQTRAFQAEVKQILDIVINSLYTNREIFVRELISNAADALEKLRYEKVTDESIADPDLPPEIRIEVDETAKTITITDTGIGMSEEDLIENLGTIAHSGTKDYLKKLAEAGSKNVELIGQFGVGFYSSFMVAKHVTVFSRSAKPEEQGVKWVSDGSGEYTIEPAPDLKRGTRIVLNLRDDSEDFASKAKIERIIKQYSNFVPFPIKLGGETVNTVQALWTKNKNEIKDEDYTEFYKFIANDFQEPMFRYHFTADVPLQISALLFVPQENFEQLWMGKVDSGVNLYCKKVLIQQHSDVILPDWLRFVKGVIDSEDLPLNISRETMQDNVVVRKLKKVITSRFLKYLDEQAKNDPEKYKTFWNKFGIFIKEGITKDFEHRDELTPLLRFESSKEEEGKPISLSDYVARLRLGQNSIYYVSGSNRAAIESGPYIEAFRKKDIEVLYVYEPIDEFVLTQIQEFEGKKIVSADQADLDLPDIPDVEEKSDEKEEALNREEAESLAAWFKKTLGDRVDNVRESKRLVDSPAIVVNADTAMTSGMQRIMQAVNQDSNQIGKKNLEINPSHPIMIQLARHKENKDEEFLKTVVDQIYDNALMAGGLLTDTRPLINRNYTILEKALKSGEE